MPDHLFLILTSNPFCFFHCAAGLVVLKRCLWCLFSVHMVGAGSLGWLLLYILGFHPLSERPRLLKTTMKKTRRIPRWGLAVAVRQSAVQGDTRQRHAAQHNIPHSYSTAQHGTEQLQCRSSAVQQRHAAQHNIKQNTVTAQHNIEQNVVTAQHNIEQNVVTAQYIIEQNTVTAQHHIEQNTVTAQHNIEHSYSADPVQFSMIAHKDTQHSTTYNRTQLQHSTTYNRTQLQHSTT